MKKIKKGDIVGRISYGKDIFFIVDRIIQAGNNKIAILKGLTVRITADSYIDDLELIEKEIIKGNLYNLENEIISRIKKNKLNRRFVEYGRILHLDGDARYSQKSAKYYRNIGINAIVKNVSENRQPRVILNLLERYKPDILIATGHDGMIKNGMNFNDVYNYRNSMYFIKTVKLARMWDKKRNELAIFAGACQSYYEALIEAGANFASSPARILIDFIDPLIVAENIAMAPVNKFVSIRDFEMELRDGQKGISGIGSMGKRRY